MVAAVTESGYRISIIEISSFFICSVYHMIVLGRCGTDGHRIKKKKMLNLDHEKDTLRLSCYG